MVSWNWIQCMKIKLLGLHFIVYVYICMVTIERKKLWSHKTNFTTFNYWIFSAKAALKEFKLTIFCLHNNRRINRKCHFNNLCFKVLHICAFGEGGRKDKGGLYLLLMFSITHKCHGSGSQTELETAFQLANNHKGHTSTDFLEQLQNMCSVY